MTTRLLWFEHLVLRRNYERGNSAKLSAQILHKSVDLITALERQRGLYRKGRGSGNRGRKQKPEHVAKRVKNWGRKKRSDEMKEIGNKY